MRLGEDVLRLLDARPPDDQPLLLVRLRDDVEVDVEDMLESNLPVVLCVAGTVSVNRFAEAAADG